MSLQAAFNFIPAFVLAFFRVTGLMLMSPLFGSARVPKRVKAMFALVTTIAMVSAVPRTVVLPPTLVELAFRVAGEMAFGLAMGSIVSFTFIAAQWAGEMIGQQIGFNLSEVFDPQFGQAGSLVGDLYFMITLVVFLGIGGHRIMLRAVHASFQSVPLLSFGVSEHVFDEFVGLFTGAMVLAMRLAAPMFFTMLVVDLAMGCIGRAMPQFNIMNTGLPVRSILGVLVLIASLVVTSQALQESMASNLTDVYEFFTTRPAHG